MSGPEVPDEAAAADRRLMARTARGDADAFALLYDRFARRAHRIARAVCRDEGQAQEAVQEAFTSVWRSREAYRPQGGSVAAWVLTIVRNRAVDLSRRDQVHASRRAGEELVDLRPAPGDVVAETSAREDAKHLREALARLPDDQREVITLAFYGQLSHSEIATHLRLPSGTVKGRMRLGLSKLRRETERLRA